MEIINVIVGLIIIVVIAYVGIVLFSEMVKTLWQISPITSIGFIISVIIAILKGHIAFGKLEGNIRILVFIFGGTVLSYAATSLIPNMLNIVLAGDFISAIIIGLVILVVWFKGQEIKGRE